MYHYRIILADGVYHYLNADTGAQAKRKFARQYPTLPKPVGSKRMGAPA